MSSGTPTPSNQAFLELYVFACGHGDTVLLKFPGEKWGLVDCHLPVADGTRAKFFKFVEDNRIVRLEFIVQTHPDTDHFLGMTEVLEFFTVTPRSIGAYLDGGFVPKDIVELVLGRDNPFSRQYQVLQETITRLDNTKLLSYRRLDSQSLPVVQPKGFEGRIAIVVVSPSPSRQRAILRRDATRLGRNRKHRSDTNGLSLVLVLSARDLASEFVALLPADAGDAQIKESYESWSQKPDRLSVSTELDFVKVPHHGSIHSHCKFICEDWGKKQSLKLAAISAGDRPNLPHRNVIETYAKNGWEVGSTTTRHGGKRKQSPIHLRAGRSVPSVKRHTIRVEWNSSIGMSWGPIAAKIESSDLLNY